MAKVADRDPRFLALLESAAHLQQLVPGAVMVGGAAVLGEVAAGMAAP